MSGISHEVAGLILICVTSSIGIAMACCCCYMCCCRPNPYALYYTTYVYRHRIAQVTPLNGVQAEPSHDVQAEPSHPVAMLVAEPVDTATNTNTSVCVAVCDSNPKMCVVVVNP